MKQTPEERKILDNFQPGAISKDGFLGSDDRHIHDIVEEDHRILSRMGLNPEMIAKRLKYFIHEGKKGFGSKVDLEGFTVRVEWDRGMLPCPFGEAGLHPKIVATVTHKEKKKTISYSQLSVHMIQQHCFFGGRGSVFRLDPEELVDVVDMRGCE